MMLEFIIFLTVFGQKSSVTVMTVVFVFGSCGYDVEKMFFSSR